KLVENRDVTTDGRTRREIRQSVASAAWVNEALLRAGFAPSDLTVISEACNAGRVHATTADGFSPAEVQRLQRQVNVLGHYDARYWLYVDGERAKGFNPGRSAQDSYVVRPAEVLDARPSEAASGFAWLGYVSGVNT